MGDADVELTRLEDDRRVGGPIRNKRFGAPALMLLVGDEREDEVALEFHLFFGNALGHRMKLRWSVRQNRTGTLDDLSQGIVIVVMVLKALALSVAVAVAPIVTSSDIS